MKQIAFHKHDYTEAEARAVYQAALSGWISNGPITQKLEKKLTEYCAALQCSAVNSATSGLFLTLKTLGIVPGDEVITTSLTFAATANVILHCGAVPVFADIGEDWNISLQDIKKKITSKTKAVIAVDLGGNMCCYKDILDVLRRVKIKTGSAMLRHLGRPVLIADAAHSFGSMSHGGISGSQADFSVLSFHAVKNITCADGGAVLTGPSAEVIAKDFRIQFLKWANFGRDISAVDMQSQGGVFYDIGLPGYKCLMNDLSSSLVLAQLKRFTLMQRKREKIGSLYNKIFSKQALFELRHQDKNSKNNFHLFMVRLKKGGSIQRDKILKAMKVQGYSLNVHYKPVVLMSYYKTLGYSLKGLTKTDEVWQGLISLPVYPSLSPVDAKKIASALINTAASI